MSTTTALRIEPRKLGVLKALYVYTIIGAGAAGVWSLFAPLSFAMAFGVASADPYMVGMSGAVDTAFAPRAVNSDTPGYAWVVAVVFLSYVVFDLVALPFAQLTSDE